MSEALTPILPVDSNALLLRAVEDGELTTQLSVDQLHEIELKIDAAHAAARDAIETIKLHCGPNPGFLPGRLMVIIHMGAGYTITARDAIRALWRKKNAAEKKKGQSSHD